jgi:hypothetical protein
MCPLPAVLLALMAAPAHATELFTVDPANKLRSFDVMTPASASEVTITGLQTGETVAGIDFRPMNNALYGLGSTGRLYTINMTTGAAAQVGSAFALSGTSFGIDFNPVADRIRVVSDADQNLRINPDDGVVTTDPMLHYGAGDPNESQNPNVVASAYSNNFLGATMTTRYGIDSARDALVMKSPPNDGALWTIGPLGVDFSATSGFDMLDDGSSYASTAGVSSSTVYRVNPATGSASFLFTLPYVVSGLTGSPTGAAGPFSGMLHRGPGSNQLDFTTRNDGQRPIEFMAVQFASGFTPISVERVSGPDVDCNLFPANRAVSCAFFGPNYWAPGQELVLRIGTDPRYPDNGGAQMFVCARMCAPFFRDAGPFSFGGPAPAGTTPPPGGVGDFALSWGDGAWNRASMLTHLLPYIEQRPAFQVRGRNWGIEDPGTPTIVKTYGCPSRPQSQSDPSGWDLAPGDPGPWNLSWGMDNNGKVRVLQPDGSVREVTPECQWQTLYNALGTRKGGRLGFGARASGRRPRVRRLKLGTARVTVPAGETRVVATRINRRARRTLKRQRVRRLRVEVRYTVRSPVGDKITAKRTFRVKLRRARRGG